MSEFIEWTSLFSKSVQASYYNPFHLPYPLSPIDTKTIDGDSVLFASTPTKNIHEERPIELVPILLLDSRNPSYDSSTIDAVPFTSNSQREKSLSLQQNGITSSINIPVKISSRSTLPSRSRPYFYVPIPTHKSNLVNIQIVNSMEKTQTAITKEHVPKPLSDMQRSKLRIAHLNVRSIKNRNHLIQVRELMKDRNYDILALSESWLNSTVTNAEVEIEGFKLTRLDRLGKTGGGVCVYSKSSIKVKCLKNITGISEFGFHQLWMLIQLRKLRSILLCVPYRPDYCPTSTFHDIFMENYIHALTLGKEIIVVGDLNCDLLKPDSPEAMSLLDFCTSVNQTQLIKEPTRVTETSSSLIDIIMTSNVSLVITI